MTLEELVGEIYDEIDQPPQHYMCLSEGGILVGGDVELRVVEEFFKRDLPGKPTDTVSRWILTHTARIPEKGERLRSVGGLRGLVAGFAQRESLTPMGNDFSIFEYFAKHQATGKTPPDARDYIYNWMKQYREDPDKGKVACGDEGYGRLADIDIIFKAVSDVLK